MKNGLNERNRKSEMIDRECGTKQLKSVITKENLKKPEQTQKKNFRTNRFCGTLGMVFPGISESDSTL